MEITYKLKYWRTKRGMSIDDLAAASGCSTSTIVAAEKHGKTLRPTTLGKLSKALDISIDELQEVKLVESEKKEIKNKGSKFALAG